MGVIFENQKCTVMHFTIRYSIEPTISITFQMNMPDISRSYFSKGKSLLIEIGNKTKMNLFTTFLTNQILIIYYTSIYMPCRYIIYMCLRIYFHIIYFYLYIIINSIVFLRIWPKPDMGSTFVSSLLSTRKHKKYIHP